jgi:transposase
MRSECTQVAFFGQDVYVGLDVAKRSWRVCIYLGQLLHKQFSQSPDPTALVRYLERNFPGATYHSIYEAGYCGFWIHQALVELGVDSVVVHPADVPTTDKERTTKTDRVDAAKLARSLLNGDFQRLYIPDEQALEDRALLRMRARFISKQTRCKNQIKSHLSFHGIHMPEDIADRYWSRSYIGWLNGLTFTRESGRIAFQALLGELLSLRKTLSELTREIRALSRQQSYRRNVELLTSVPGIGLLAAMTFLTEVVAIDRFKALDQLCSYVGLVPGEYSSGDHEQKTGLVSRRNSALRYILIECAWTAQHEDPALLESFRVYCARLPKTVAIVHIARKLLARMRFVLKHDQLYVKGVLKAA